jgi:hypothetical protein
MQNVNLEDALQNTIQNVEKWSNGFTEWAEDTLQFLFAVESYGIVKVETGFFYSSCAAQIQICVPCPLRRPRRREMPWTILSEERLNECCELNGENSNPASFMSSHSARCKNMRFASKTAGLTQITPNVQTHCGL